MRIGAIGLSNSHYGKRSSDGARLAVRDRLFAAFKPTTSCPFVPYTQGLQQAKRWLEEVNRDDRGSIFLLFSPQYDRENPETTKQNP